MSETVCPHHTVNLASWCFLPLSQTATDRAICKPRELIWLVVLETGKARVKGPHPVRAYLSWDPAITLRKPRPQHCFPGDCSLGTLLSPSTRAWQCLGL